MKFKKMLSLLAATAIAAGSFAAMAVTANAEVTSVTYALTEGQSFTSSQAVEVKNGDDVVATITYGESGGAAFNTTKNGTSNINDSRFTYFTEGNGENGNKTGGTFYTIVPNYDGTVEVAVVLNKDKIFTVEENGTAMTDYCSDAMTAKYYGTFTFPVSANKSYKFYTAGSKLGFYGFTYNIGGTLEPVVDTKYAITVAEGIEHGSVSINGDLTEATAGTTINVTATPDTGYVLDKITVNGTDVTGTSFKMPAAAAVVSATFTEYVAPVKQEMPIGATVVFDDFVGSIADGAIVADYILVNDKNAKVAVDSNNKTVDEVAYKTRIKSGGNTAVYTITPKADGTLQVLALSANANDARAFAVNGEEATSPASASGVVPEWFSFDVKGGTDVTITFPGGGVNIYCIKLVEASPAPQQQFYNKGYTFTTSNDVASKKYTTLTINVNDTANENKPGYATINVADQIATITGPAALTIFIKNIPAAYTVTSVELD